MALWRDTRHPIEVEADLRYAAARTGRVVEASKKLDAVLTAGIVEGKRMSLFGKMEALTESAQDFHKSTESALDGIAEKIAFAKVKREAAVAKHHGYYDAIIKGVDDSTAVIDRLSNVPLGEGGEG